VRHSNVSTLQGQLRSVYREYSPPNPSASPLRRPLTAVRLYRDLERALLLRPTASCGRNMKFISKKKEWVPCVGYRARKIDHLQLTTLLQCTHLHTFVEVLECVRFSICRNRTKTLQYPSAFLHLAHADKHVTCSSHSGTRETFTPRALVCVCVCMCVCVSLSLCLPPPHTQQSDT
jgi:hypothetical protein